MTHQFRSHKVVRHLAVAACVGASVGACASSGGAASSEHAAAQPSSSRYLLVEADLAKVKADNVYDAITKLRPEFLRGRNENGSFVQQSINGGSKDPGAASAPGSGMSSVGTAALSSTVPVMVYRDNVKLGGVDDLRQIQLSTVREIRYLQGPDAVIRFGTNNSSGAILITSK